MPSWPQVVLLAVASLVAGCMGESAAPDGSDPPVGQGPQATAIPGPKEQEDPSPAAIADSMELTDCHGLSSLHYLPAPMAETAIPPGWRGPEDIVQYSFEVLECARVSIGPYERGPVRVLQEWYSSGRAPEQCMEGDFMAPRMLHAWWFDSREIAAYLRDNFQAPAAFAEFVLNESPQAGFAFVDWTVSLEGTPVAMFHGIESTGLDSTSTGSFRDRMFWVNGGGGVNYVDLGVTWGNNFFSPHAIYGTIRPPLVLYSVEAENFATLGELITGVDAHADFAQFGDLECREPT